MIFGMSALFTPHQWLRHLAQRHDQQVLHAAKSAVIDWAAANYPGRFNKNVRLGELVMPDKNGPNEGLRFGSQDASARIGRLPWRTLGIPPLYDAHGESLWYLVESGRRDNLQLPITCHMNQIQLNSRQQANIMTQGVAAVIFVPHRALLQQQRYTDEQQRAASNYLDKTSHYTNYFRTNTWRLVQGPVKERDITRVNDIILPVECTLIERILAKRRRHAQG
jgi:hypothetical protein